MEYIKLFETVSAYTEARENEYIEPWVSYTLENEQVDFNKSEYEKLFGTPLTFEITSNGNIKWTLYNPYNISATARTIEYKKNDGEWTSITATTGGTEINVVSGDAVQFRGNVPTFGAGGPGMGVANCFSGSTAEFNVKGNIMSLIDSTGFTTATTLVSSYTFNILFGNCSGLTSAENLVLPAETLASYCYKSMFANCTSLTQTPALLAEALASNCYDSMFDSCTGLRTAPSLPAETLAGYCYQYMFIHCTSLTQSPELPAETLASSCYSNMFRDCTSLTSAPELPATTLADSCYNGMFMGCTGLTTAPALPTETLAVRCYDSMFRGCTSLTTAPALPATTLASCCYYNMFRDCTSLTTAPELPATTLAESCYESMFSGCTNLNYIKCLAINLKAGTPPKLVTTNWVSGVQTTSGTFVKAAGISESTWGRGNNGIPTNWTVQDA